MMKRYLIVSLIMFSITTANLFALDNFIQQQTIHQHEFCVLFAHEHHHFHSNMKHSHGHSHEVNLVDFYSEQTADITAALYADDKHCKFDWYYKKIIPGTLFRPPIS